MNGLELDLDLRTTYRHWRDLVDGLSSNTTLAQVFPNARVAQTLAQSGFLLLDNGAALRHIIDQEVAVRLRVAGARNALAFTIVPSQGGTEP
jgi:hypothetical protein